MKSIKDVEDAIIARLKAQIPDVSVEKTQDEPSRYKLDHPKGAVVVYYTGSNFFSPLSYAALEQKTSYQFAVSVFVKDLHGNDGAYELLLRVKEALGGYSIFQNKLVPLSIRLVNSRKSLWHYEAKFEICLP